MRHFILAAAALASFAAAPAFASEGTYAPTAVASGFAAKGPVAVLNQVPFNMTENGVQDIAPRVVPAANAGRIAGGSYSFTAANGNG